jgi:ATP-binding cassette subfamily B protein
MGCVIFYAGHSIASGHRDAGSLIAFITALLLAYEPAKRLTKLRLKLETALIGVGIVYEFLDMPSSMTDKPGAADLKVPQGEVELRDVTFSYNKKDAALENLSITFPAGKVSALVGSSGAGKSTIFALIERFYDPQLGQVLIDGQDARDVTMASLRGSMAFVTQDSFLFEGTIRENIMAGRREASEAEMFAAAKAANAHEFISAFPQGYERKVGEGGGNLSGGQRQRVAIARAMLRNAPILLLDEATSALDAVSEAKVKQALDALMKGRTTIVIAHRLSTVRNADIIHVVEDGQLVESGTHAALVAAGGTYAHLSALQFTNDEDMKLPAKTKSDLAPAAE